MYQVTVRARMKWQECGPSGLTPKAGSEGLLSGTPSLCYFGHYLVPTDREQPPSCALLSLWGCRRLGRVKPRAVSAVNLAQLCPDSGAGAAEQESSAPRRASGLRPPEIYCFVSGVTSAAFDCGDTRC